MLEHTDYLTHWQQHPDVLYARPLVQVGTTGVLSPASRFSFYIASATLCIRHQSTGQTLICWDSATYQADWLLGHPAPCCVQMDPVSQLWFALS
jgi:hypothetical protein